MSSSRVFSRARYKHTAHIDIDALSFTATQLLNGGNESSIGGPHVFTQLRAQRFLENLSGPTSSWVFSLLPPRGRSPRVQSIGQKLLRPAGKRTQ
jgi:hypothetical protein